MQTLSEDLGARTEALSNGVNNLAMEMQQLRRGGKREAKPKTIPPWLAQFYVNQHVECSNDRTNWHDATITRIDPAAHVLELHVWNNGVGGWRFVRPLQRPRDERPLKRPR